MFRFSRKEKKRKRFPKSKSQRMKGKNEKLDLLQTYSKSIVNVEQ